MVKTRKCIADGTKYSYCPDCSRSDALKPTWYNDFCSESCKDLWFTLARYNMGRITKDEARSAILELDIKPIEEYSKFVQRDYAKVMAEEKKHKRGKRAEAHPIAEAISAPEEVVESAAEQIAEIQIEQPAEVVETVAIEHTVHGVVIEKENE